MKTTSFVKTFALVGSLMFTVAFAGDSYSYRGERALAEAGPAPSFQINSPAAGYASCYGSSYYYYKAW